MASAKTLVPFFSLLVLIATVIPNQALSQEIAVPSRPESRIHDTGSVFETGERTKIAAEIQAKLDALLADTGCDVLVVTVTSSTGTTPRILADQFAGAWLNPAQKGAILLYERTGHRVVISTTEPARDTIADYIFASIEQTATEGRKDASPAEAVSLSTADLAAVFRKYFGEAATREHPAINAGRLLMAVVAACIAGMIAVVATLHWRGEKLPA